MSSALSLSLANADAASHFQQRQDDFQDRHQEQLINGAAIQQKQGIMQLCSNGAMEPNADRDTDSAVDKTPNEDEDEDDEAFAPPLPSLDEDEDEDAEDDSMSRPPPLFDEASNAEGVEDTEEEEEDEEEEEEEDGSKAGTPDPAQDVSGRKNKRKNFRPRNILKEQQDVSSFSPLNLSQSQGESPMALLPLMSLLRRPYEDRPTSGEAAGAPMDLSVASPAGGRPHPGGVLSVVRPEVLFGRKCQAEADEQRAQPFLKPSSDAMKEAFQEVLKLYGVPSDIAETIAKNAQAAQERLSHDPSSRVPPTLPSSPLAFSPAMLSAALLGSSASPSSPPSAQMGTPTAPPTAHPPTPPRTPKTPSSASLMAAMHEQAKAFKPMLLPGLLPPGLLPPQSQHPMPMVSQHHPLPMVSHPLLKGMGVNLGMGMLPVGLAKAAATDYTRYFRRFGSSVECGGIYCRDMNYREHFHCTVPMCKEKVFAKKEEMIRHSKWHQKMDEALKYGFRRVTPTDDCSDAFPGCSHNRKQTHYHCIQALGACDKVYISTSDVQMHFNYHRKDNAIQREGFLRFRGAEDCNAAHCAYRGQKTTHFHCNRSGCLFTFKNKADMEKHKNYHMKDEQLNRDGFKKFMKHEPCGFEGCRFSRSVNHIHCIRADCDYVLHSSGQLYSHKRKHERKDTELAYRRYKLSNTSGASSGTAASDDRPPSCGNESLSSESMTSTPPPTMTMPMPSAVPLNLPISPVMMMPKHEHLEQPLWSEIMREKIPSSCWSLYLLHFDGGEGCGFQRCECQDVDHFHCKEDCCENVFRAEDAATDHARSHFLQDRVTDAFYSRRDPDDDDDDDCHDACPFAKARTLHFHCKWDHCCEVVSSSDPPFKRLEHYKLHEYSRKWQMASSSMTMARTEPVSMTLTTTADTMFKRKRGRPPKNRVVEHGAFGGSSPLPDLAPQAVFTSFKLQKTPESPKVPFVGGSSPAFPFGAGTPTPPKVMAPLGGLPAMVSQMEAASASRPSREDALAAAHRAMADIKSDDSPPKAKARGTYYPLTAFPTSMPQGPVMHSRDEAALNMEESAPKNEQTSDETSPSISFKSKLGVNFLVSCARQPEPETESALAKLLQQAHGQSAQISPGMQFGPEPEEEACGRPFCKLKRRAHFHCTKCNQGFTEKDKLESHMERHGPECQAASESPQLQQHLSLAALLRDGVPPTSTPPPPPPTGASRPAPSSPQAPPPSPPKSMSSPSPTSPFMVTSSPFGAPGSFGGLLRSPFGHPAMGGALLPHPFFNAGFMLPGMPFAPRPGAFNQTTYDPSKHPLTRMPCDVSAFLKRSASEDDDAAAAAESHKKMRLQTSMRMLKDEPVPEGYMRFRFNEDCGFCNCNYREHQTHFHCMRRDCNYRFCDKTRFVQHTARHERLDTLCGQEFEGYRGVSCGREACEFNVNNTRVSLGGDSQQKSSSHFHCLKCDYYCTDTNKVVAHRRQHQKLDSIMAAGFDKFTPTQTCTGAMASASAPTSEAAASNAASGSCAHNGKQTHYHCRKCQYAVLGLSQMEAHKYRHLNE